MSGIKLDLLVVIPCTESDSLETFRETLEAVVRQKNHPFNSKIVVRCNPNCLEELFEFAKGQAAINHVTIASTSFLDPLSIESAFTYECKYFLLCSCGVVPHENCFSFLDDKIKEYGDGVLTARGMRLFPHEKLHDPLKQIKEGVHWKLYDESKTDRAVDFFTLEFCLISANIHRQVATHDHSDTRISQLSSLWYSFVVGHYLRLSIWKIQANAVLDCKNAKLSYFVPGYKPDCFKQFYFHLHECNWPQSISHPFHNVKKMKVIKQCKEIPQEIWKKGFGGVNMASEPATKMDFAAAAAYGVKVIRVGAVCDAKDLAYLIDPQASTFEEDKKHFLSVVPRLRQALSNASDYGLKMVITMTDLPGSKFHSRPDGPSFAFWESPLCRSRAAKFWGLVAESLVDINSIIMAYDVINEPYTPEDTEVDFFDDMPLARADELHQFYVESLCEIRKHDKEVAVMVKSTWFACPKTFEMLQPLSDSNVVYSFHMYAPPHLTLHRNSQFSYPGPVSRWLCYPEETVNITPEFLHQLLKNTVYSWQRKHHIPPYCIVVAEFGMCRETRGSQCYLNDLILTFEEFGWSWFLFSFRDEEWDALDYELGTNKDNMLYRSPTELFMTVADHFH